jgi:transposase-like protein
MGQKCTICNHDKKLQIDRALVEGKSTAKIAREYGVSENSLHNHKHNHLSHQLVTAYQQKEVVTGNELLQKIDDLVDKSAQIFRRNFDKKRDVVALQALSQQRSTFELLAKIQVEMHKAKIMEAEQRQQIDVMDCEAQVQKRIARLSDDEQKVYFLLLQKMQRQYDGNCLPEQKTNVRDLFTANGLANLTKKELPLLSDLIDKAAGKHKKLIRWSTKKDEKSTKFERKASKKEDPAPEPDVFIFKDKIVYDNE